MLRLALLDLTMAFNKYNDMKRLLLICSFLCMLAACKKENKDLAGKPYQYDWWAIEFEPTSLDHIMTSCDNLDSAAFWKDGMSISKIDEQDFQTAKQIIIDGYPAIFQCYKDFDTLSLFPLRYYFRQYLPFSYQGKQYVYVNLYTHVQVQGQEHVMNIIAPDERKHLLPWGKEPGHYGMMIVDLTDKKIAYYHFNRLTGSKLGTQAENVQKDSTSSMIGAWYLSGTCTDGAWTTEHSRPWLRFLCEGYGEYYDSEGSNYPSTFEWQLNKDTLLIFKGNNTFLGLNQEPIKLSYTIEKKKADNYLILQYSKGNGAVMAFCLNKIN